MATSREERMAQRMRGAQRHQVQDISFAFAFPVAEEPGDGEQRDVEAEAGAEAEAEGGDETTAAPTTRTTPNSSAKRRRLDTGDAPGPAIAPQAAEGSPRRVSKRIQDGNGGSTGARTSPNVATRSGGLQRTARTATAASSARRAGGAAFGLSPGAVRLVEEEVGESPTDAPGSGQRRTVRVGAAAAQSALLQHVIAAGGGGEEEDEDADADPVQNSSPLARKTTAPRPAVRRRGIRVSADSGEVDELSPAVPAPQAETQPRRSPAAVGAAKATLRKKAGAASPAALPKTTSARRSARQPAANDEVDELSSPAPSDPAAAIQYSSPLARRSEQSLAATASRTRSSGAVRPSPLASVDALEIDELSPDQPRRPNTSAEARQQEPPKKRKVGAKATGSTATAAAPATAEVAQVEEAEAEEIDDHEAARRLGRKRPRRSLREPSPDLSSQPATQEQEDSQPTAKRLRRQAKDSPSVQKQPKPQKKQPQPPKAKPPPPPPQQQQQPKKKRAAAKPKETASKNQNAAPDANANAEDEDGDANASVPVTVQRFTRRIRYGEDDDADDADADILGAAEIPYANRGGVNPVDVLWQMCEEIIEQRLEALHEQAAAAEEAAARRELRVRMRALEAFQEELRTRLLEQTIALDTLHALRKRVRAAQREKLALRDEIVRVRAERGHVALRMDAVRARHQAESERALHHISLSSTMHDLDLAVERGRAAPEPATLAERRAAELPNLELLIARVSEQACSYSSTSGGVGGGGTGTGTGTGVLGKIKEFNAFLERAASVLEGRG